MTLETRERADLDGGGGHWLALAVLDGKTGGAAAGVAAFLTGQLSERTRRAYLADFGHFLRFLELQPGASREAIISALCSVDAQTAVRFRDGLMASYAPATAARRMSVVMGVYETLKAEGAVPKNPFSRVKRPKVSNEGKTAALTKAQAEKLIHTPNRTTRLGDRDFLLLATLFSLGLRRAEAVQIQVADFKETNGHMTVRILGKGGKEATAKVPPPLWREVTGYVQRWGVSGYLFPAISRNPKLNGPGRPMSTAAVFQLFRKYAKRAGLDWRNLSPHSARATAVTLALNGGASVRQVQSFARHASADTTLRYDRNRLDLDDAACDYLRLRLADGGETPAQKL